MIPKISKLNFIMNKRTQFSIRAVFEWFFKHFYYRQLKNMSLKRMSSIIKMIMNGKSRRVVFKANNAMTTNNPTVSGKKMISNC